MMVNTGSATAQSSSAQSNLQAVQTNDQAKKAKEDLQKMGKLFREVYDTFKKYRNKRQIGGETPAAFITNANEKFQSFKNNNESGNTSSSALKVKSHGYSKLKEFVKSIKSDGFSKLKDFVLAAASATQGMITATGGKDFTKETLKIMGSAHCIGAALLLVVFLLEGCEMISKNKEECFDLLQNMASLVSILYQLSDRSTELSEMGDFHLQEIIRECTETIMDGYDLIWSKLEAAKIKRLFSAKTEKEALAKLRQELDNKFFKLMAQMSINSSSTRPHAFEFPEEAVGLFDEVNKTIDQMEWEDNEEALAVVLHGYSGSGKTTLGDAVYHTLNFNKPPGFLDGRCAVIRLYRGMDSFQIMEAQSILINNLQNSYFKPNSTNEGRNKIGNILRNIPAFIYIDKLEGVEELKELLPHDMKSAKKLRLLVTCRDTDHCMSLKLSRPPILHRIKPLSEEAATEFIHKNLGKEAWFNTIISKEITDMCRGIPKLLDGVVSYLRNKGEEGLEIVQEQYKQISYRFGDDLVIMLGLEDLGNEEREALLDILYFFKQENWNEVKRIVRADILEKLACKSLVERTHQEAIKIDDVISYITQEEARKTRFTTEEQIHEFLKAKEHPDQLEGMKNIKGISVPSTMGTVDIPHILLDHVQGSIRVLKLGMKGKIGGEYKKRFDKLIYLDCCRVIRLKTPKLRCLRLLSDIPDIEVNQRTFWLAEFENLQEISGYSLKTLPNGLGLLKKLQVLELSCHHDCKDLGSAFVHPSHEIELFLCDHLKSGWSWLKLC